MELIPPSLMVELAKVMTFGAEKYGDRNWEKGIKYMRLYGAMQRHLHAWAGGEDLDPETGLSHLAHAAFGVAALLDFASQYSSIQSPLDDRPRR